MYGNIDIEYLLNTPGSAIFCSTEEESKQFLSYMKEHCPEKCEYWEDGETRFVAGGIGYTFYWTAGTKDWRSDNLMFGNISELLYDNYTVLNFNELAEVKDIEESEQAIESLFGGVV